MTIIDISLTAQIAHSQATATRHFVALLGFDERQFATWTLAYYSFVQLDFPTMKIQINANLKKITMRGEPSHLL
jgi:hypothetical protein